MALNIKKVVKVQPLPGVKAYPPSCPKCGLVVSPEHWLEHVSGCEADK